MLIVLHSSVIVCLSRTPCPRNSFREHVSGISVEQKLHLVFALFCLLLWIVMLFDKVLQGPAQAKGQSVSNWLFWMRGFSSSTDEERSVLRTGCALYNRKHMRTHLLSASTVQLFQCQQQENEICFSNYENRLWYGQSFPPLVLFCKGIAQASTYCYLILRMKQGVCRK